MQHITDIAKKAKDAARRLAVMSTGEKNAILMAIADALEVEAPAILEQNALDVAAARAKGRTEALIDRLALSEKRIKDMADGVRAVADLPDPVGEVLHATKRPNGLVIQKRRTPMGVVGIIYEARPNVTSDVIALCLKSGNAVVLRGGSEAINSNKAIAGAAIAAAEKAGLPKGAAALIEDTTHEAAQFMMGLTGYIDVLIPRGGAGLIRNCVENAKVPVIETGTGNCHTFVDATADFENAIDIIINAKTQRPSVCNAMETLLVHEVIADEFLPEVCAALEEKGVEIRGDERTCEIVPGAKPATDQDYATEFLDLILAVKVVADVGEAIDHIAKYSSRHSEAILTNDYSNARRFQDEVDSAAVYVNASTRFTDGFEFGFGAEIGISTQKLHARGPMGLAELTTTKYVIDGDGQIR